PIRNGAEHGDFAAACQMANWPAWANPLPVRAPLPWIAARSVRSTVPPVTAARDDRLCLDVAARGRSSLLWIKDQAPRRNYLSSTGISGQPGSQPLEASHEHAPGRGSIREEAESGGSQRTVRRRAVRRLASGGAGVAVARRWPVVDVRVPAPQRVDARGLDRVRRD